MNSPCCGKTSFVGYFSVLAAVLVLAAVMFLSGCAERKEPQLQFLLETENGTVQGDRVPSERIEELRKEIRRYETEVEEAVHAYAMSGSYHKMLAHELLKEEMYGPALESLQRAMELQPANPVVYYFAGVAAARSARAHMLDGREDEYLKTAERLFDEALRLRPDYQDALFAMAVLLAFDLDRPEDALTYSRRLTSIETGDPSVRFLHGNVLVRNGLVSEAIEVYDDLARTAPSAEQRARARENRDELERMR